MKDQGLKLRDLRDRLARVDGDILRLLAERTRAVRAVAELKVTEKLAPFVRDRETEKILELERRAGEMGVSEELVRDVFGALMAGSRAAQRAALVASEDRLSIGVVGGTQGMGAFLARIFASVGHTVDAMGLDHGDPAEAVASRNDLVIVAVPIAATCDVIGRVAPRMREGACLMDVTSLKRAPMEAMLAAAPEGVEIVGTHPMFGPHAGGDMDRQKVVLCRGRGERAYTRVRRLYESFGAEIVEATAEEHDAQMALIQVLVHTKTMVVGSALERLGANLGRSLDFASPIYRAELAMVGRLFSQAPDLYAEILTNNPDGARVVSVFAAEAAKFSAALGAGDRGSIVARFREVAAFLRDFAGWARRQSDAILEDIVRHG